MKKIVAFGLIILIWMLQILSCAKPKSPQLQENLLCQAEGNTKPNQDICNYYWKNLQMCMNWSWQVPASSSQKGSMLIKMTRPHRVDQTPVLQDLDYDLVVTLWMPSMGHGSLPTRIRKVDVGSWLIENIFFTMPGDWEIRLAWKENTQIKDELVLRFDIVW